MIWTWIIYLASYSEACDGNFLIRKGFMSMDQSLMFVGPNVAFFKAQGKREWMRMNKISRDCFSTQHPKLCGTWWQNYTCRQAYIFPKTYIDIKNRAKRLALRDRKVNIGTKNSASWKL